MKKRHVISIALFIVLLRAHAGEDAASPEFLIPRGCPAYSTLVEQTGGNLAKVERLNAALKARATSMVDVPYRDKFKSESHEQWLERMDAERALSAEDLDREVLYFDFKTKKCAFRPLGKTLFGAWVKETLAWRKLQKLTEIVSEMPVEIDSAYDVHEWRTFPLTQKASLYDRRATNGYCNTYGDDACKIEAAQAAKAVEVKPAAETRYFIQLASFKTRPEADEYAKKIGLTTFTLQVQLQDKSEWFRVGYGGYDDSNSAESALTELKNTRPGIIAFVQKK